MKMMEINKNIEATKEELGMDIGESSKKMEKKMDSTEEEIKSTKEELNKKMDLQTTSRVKRWKE